MQSATSTANQAQLSNSEYTPGSPENKRNQTQNCKQKEDQLIIERSILSIWRPGLIIVEFLISWCFVCRPSEGRKRQREKERERSFSFVLCATKTFTGYWISVEFAFPLPPFATLACSTSRNSSSIEFRAFPLLHFVVSTPRPSSPV